MKHKRRVWLAFVLVLVAALVAPPASAIDGTDHYDGGYCGYDFQNSNTEIYIECRMTGGAELDAAADGSVLMLMYRGLDPGGGEALFDQCYTAKGASLPYMSGFDYGEDWFGFTFGLEADDSIAGCNLEDGFPGGHFGAEDFIGALAIYNIETGRQWNFGGCVEDAAVLAEFWPSWPTDAYGCTAAGGQVYRSVYNVGDPIGPGTGPGFGPPSGTCTIDLDASHGGEVTEADIYMSWSDNVTSVKVFGRNHITYLPRLLLTLTGEDLESGEFDGTVNFPVEAYWDLRMEARVGTGLCGVEAYDGGAVEERLDPDCDGVPGPINDGEDQGCWSTEDLELTSPSTWVKAGVNGMTCSLRNLFWYEGVQGDVQELEDLCSTQAPCNWITDLVAFGSEQFGNFTSGEIAEPVPDWEFAISGSSIGGYPVTVGPVELGEAINDMEAPEQVITVGEAGMKLFWAFGIYSVMVVTAVPPMSKLGVADPEPGFYHDSDRGQGSFW